MDKPVTAIRNRELAKALKLLSRFGLFCLPLLVLLAAGEVLLWSVGENWPVSRVASRQSGLATPTLYSRSLLSQQFGIYKLEMIKQRQPQILVIGSSRVMQFRDFVFAPLDSSFYNAGGMIQGVHDVQSLADQVATGAIAAPRVLILGIDPWWLRDGAGAEESWLLDRDEAYSFAAHVKALRMILVGRESGKFRQALLARSSAGFPMDSLGIGVQTAAAGFRADGSWQYSREIMATFLTAGFVDRETPPVIERIRFRQMQFSAPAAYDEPRANVLVDSVARLSSLGVEVWAWLPPLSSQSAAAIDRDEELRALVQACQQRLLPQLAHHGAQVLADEDLRDYRMNDPYMIDGFHPGEVYSANLALAMIEQCDADSLLGAVDRAGLKQRIEAAELPLAFDGPPGNEPETVRSASGGEGRH
jgi:hypothetical protein